MRATHLAEDNLIRSLNDQIEFTRPILIAHANLSDYYSRLSQRLLCLNNQQNQFNDYAELSLRELAFEHTELQKLKGELNEECREVLSQEQKIIMERKKLLMACDALSNRFSLEKNREAVLIKAASDIQENKKSLQKDIDGLKKSSQGNSNKVKEICKSRENLLRQIQGNQEINKELSESKAKKEEEFSRLQQKNKGIYKRIEQLDEKRVQFQRKINELEQKNYNAKQRQIRIEQQIQENRTQGEYAIRLIDNEHRVEDQLKSMEYILRRKLEQCENTIQNVVNQQHSINSKLIQEHQLQKQRKKYHTVQISRLADLRESNLLILRHMENSCNDDRRVFGILNKKLIGLEAADQMIVSLEAEPPFSSWKMRNVSQSLKIQLKNDKESTGSSWKVKQERLGKSRVDEGGDRKSVDKENRKEVKGEYVENVGGKI